MLVHKTWDTKDWHAIDNEDRKGGIVEDKDAKLEQGKPQKTEAEIIIL